MHLHSYLKSAKAILLIYDGMIPFAPWLKNYFKENRKYGSRDRKFISNLCYCFYRMGRAMKEVEIEEKLLAAQALCYFRPNPFIDELKPEWKDKLDADLKKKLNYLNIIPNAIFPFPEEISNQIDLEVFQLSHLIQPDVFLRIRPGKEASVIEKLSSGKVEFKQEAKNILRLSTGVKVEEILALDEEVVVQDISSQQVMDLLQWNKATPKTIWDCCAASGGKTILAYDNYKNAQITVSDIRASIIQNLKKRLWRAGIKDYKSFIADVSSTDFIHHSKYDLVICDVPCSGSGTWGRTPEQLLYFEKEKIGHYQRLQKKISINASKSINQQGYLLYITCSVYKQENEDVVEYIQQNTSLKLLNQQYIKGYTLKGDTMYTALFQL